MPPTPTTAILKKSEPEIGAALKHPKFKDFMTSICKNKNLENYADDDTMYHFGLNTKTHDIKKIFGKVRVVITGGSQSRVISLGKLLHQKYINDETEPVDYAIQAGRFSMFCVGHVLTFNHGMGTGSASIAFHECLKLLDYAGVKRSDVSLIRIGTCGGIGVNPGTICLTRSVLTETLEENFPFVECGKVKPMPMILDSDLGDKLAELATGLGVSSLVCKTLGTNDFYLGQGRLDGAFCDYDADERYSFLKTLHGLGVRNIEMESHTFAAFCNRAGVQGAVMCVALLNRLGRGEENDQVTADPATMKAWMDRALDVLLQYVDTRVEE